MGADSTTYDPVLAELWPQRRINNLMFEGAKFVALCQRSQDFTEKIKHVALQYGNPQGRSAAFDKAKANVGSAKFKEFGVTIVSDYGYGEVDGITLERTQSDRAALVNALERESKGAIDELVNSTAKDTWKEGDGVLGQIATGGITGNVITLESGQAKFFEEDMTLVAAATKTGSLRDSGDTMTVTAVDYDANTITVSLVANITGLAAGDYLFVEGDAADGGSLKKLTGVRLWIPTPDDTVGTLFGVDRTVHPTRLAGHRLDGSGLASKEAAIKRLIAQIRDRSGPRARPRDVWMNPMDLDDLTTELGAKKDYARVDVKDADIGFDAVTFRGPGGMVRVHDDSWIPEGYAWACDMRTWHFDSLGSAPKPITHDGSRVDRLAASDGIELRAVSRHQLYNDGPGWNGCVKLP